MYSRKKVGPGMEPKRMPEILVKACCEEPHEAIYYHEKTK